MERESMRVLGIDPGAKGAAVFIQGWNKKPTSIAFCAFAKLTTLQIADWLFENGISNTKTAYIEAVSSMPKDARSTAFTFGENTGIIKGLIYSWGTPIIEVHSQKWQRYFGLGAKYPSKTARKNAQKAKAQELFPGIKVTLDIADALLIAQYGYDTMLS
jgi:hypothetical protein